MEKVFFILLAVAIIITVCLAVSAKREKKKASRAAPPEAGRSAAPPQEQQPSETPANVAVIYEGLRVRAAKHCTACGCEYDASVIACEICGQKL